MKIELVHPNLIRRAFLGGSKIEELISIVRDIEKFANKYGFNKSIDFYFEYGLKGGDKGLFIANFEKGVWETMYLSDLEKEFLTKNYFHDLFRTNYSLSKFLHSIKGKKFYPVDDYIRDWPEAHEIEAYRRLRICSVYENKDRRLEVEIYNSKHHTQEYIDASTGTYAKFWGMPYLIDRDKLHKPYTLKRMVIKTILEANEGLIYLFKHITHNQKILCPLTDFSEVH